MQEEKKKAVRITNEDEYNSLMILFECEGWKWRGGAKPTNGTPYERAVEGFNPDLFYISVHDEFSMKEPNHAYPVHDLTDYDLIEFEKVLEAFN